MECLLLENILQKDIFSCEENIFQNKNNLINSLIKGYKQYNVVIIRYGNNSKK